MNQIPEKWLACQQNAYDRIRFIEYSNPEEINSLQYYKFLQYIQESVSIVNYEEFVSYIDRFKQVMIDLETGEWSEYSQEQDRTATFEDLVGLNRVEEEQRESRGERVVNTIWEKGRHKKSIFGLFQ